MSEDKTKEAEVAAEAEAPAEDVEEKAEVPEAAESPPNEPVEPVVEGPLSPASDSRRIDAESDPELFKRLYTAYVKNGGARRFEFKGRQFDFLGDYFMERGPAEGGMPLYSSLSTR